MDVPKDIGWSWMILIGKVVGFCVLFIQKGYISVFL